MKIYRTKDTLGDRRHYKRTRKKGKQGQTNHWLKQGKNIRDKEKIIWDQVQTNFC